MSRLKVALEINLNSIIKNQKPFLQSSVSRDPSENVLICWFAAQYIFLIINVENSCAA